MWAVARAGVVATASPQQLVAFVSPREVGESGARAEGVKGPVYAAALNFKVCAVGGHRLHAAACSTSIHEGRVLQQSGLSLF